jgi:hypothetical protein
MAPKQNRKKRYQLKLPNLSLPMSPKRAQEALDVGSTLLDETSNID